MITVAVLILIILGLTFGSFINALVWRIYKQDKAQAKAKAKKDAKYSILKGRSMCPKCEHQLTAVDLIPVLSWVSLKGKCRYCSKTISWQYPLIELLTAGLFVLSYLAWPNPIFATNLALVMFITWLVMLIGLIALAVYDIKWMFLPDKIIYRLIVIQAISLVIQFVLGKPLSEISGIALAVLIGGGVFWIIYQVSNGKWIGGGDVKLGFLLGLIVGKPEYAFLVLFLSSLIAMVFTLPLLITKKLKKDSKIPYGPFLIVATVIIVIFGTQIIDLYKSVFGLN